MNASFFTHFSRWLMLIFLCACASAADAQSFKHAIIDAGHGGKDRGASWFGVQEASLNLSVASRLEKILNAKGVPVTMTRRSDVFVPLTRRAAIANRYRDAIFVSIHFNACMDQRVRGAETFYYGTRGKVLAYEIQRQLIGRLGMKDRKIRKRPFVVLKKTRCPAVLVECGYISHSRERKRCATASFQQDAAEAIARGILLFRR